MCAYLPTAHLLFLPAHLPTRPRAALLSAQVLKGLSKSTRIAAVIPVSDFGTEPGSSAADRDLVLMSRSVSLLSVDKNTSKNHG